MSDQNLSLFLLNFLLLQQDWRPSPLVQGGRGCSGGVSSCGELRNCETTKPFPTENCHLLFKLFQFAQSEEVYKGTGQKYENECFTFWREWKVMENACSRLGLRDGAQPV